MTPVAGLPWGSFDLPLRLPVGRIVITGLSAGQHDALRHSYSAYVDTIDSDSPVVDNGVECRAYRLGEAIGLPAEALTRDGQYAPLTIAGPDGVDLTGLNFLARVPLEPFREPGRLGVAEPWDLAEPVVIENFLRVFTAHHALRRGGVVLHSAGLVVEGRAYLFAGRSGAGKTTLTRKGHQAGAVVLSDDLNLVLAGDVGYDAHAVPFTGEFGRTLAQVAGPAAYPVAGVILLERGEVLGVEPVSDSAAVARLLVACPFVNMESAVSAALFDVLSALAARVPVVALRCRREDDFDAIMTAVTDALGPGVAG